MEIMNDERRAKVMNSVAEGLAAKGRPKMGWKEGIRNFPRARIISVEEGQVKALDKKEWKKVVNG